VPVAVLKSMTDVVTRRLICEADPWETESEREKEVVKQKEGEIGGRRQRDKTKYIELKVTER